jgi:hypothetical protein
MPSTHSFIFFGSKNIHISEKQALKFKYPVAFTQLCEFKAHQQKLLKFIWCKLHFI